MIKNFEKYLTKKGYYGIKTIIIGDGSVGKTTLRRCLQGADINQNSFLPTVGADFVVKSMAFNGTKFAFQIWDLAGQPNYKNIRSTYYLASKCVILVYDVNVPASFENVTTWVEEVKKVIDEPILFLIVGNKIDLRLNNSHTITTIKGEQLINDLKLKYNFLFRFFEISAKDCLNTEQILNSIMEFFLSLISS